MTASDDTPRDLGPSADTFRDDLRAATSLLEQVIADRSRLVHVPFEERQRFLDAVGHVFHPDARARRSMVKATTKQRKLDAARRDDSVLQDTGIRELRRKPVFTTPNVYLLGDAASGTSTDAQREDDAPEAVVPQHCYICKQKFTTIHHFYDQMCLSCGDFNFAKRTELVDLSGRTALLSGGRVKIGYQAGLKLLRCGARLLVTTRFPRDSAMRYAAEPDFDAWSDRLQIFGLDLRHTPSVEAFCRELTHTESRLDFIINNACQTVRRPPAFYKHMLEIEQAAQVEINQTRDVHGEAVAAHDCPLKLLARQQIHRGQADLFSQRHHAEDGGRTTAPQHADGQIGGGWTPNRFNRMVNAALGHFDDLGGSAFGGRVDDVGCPKLKRKRPLFRDRVGSDNASSPCDLGRVDGGQAHAATADDCHGFTRRQFAGVEDGARTRCHSAADDGGTVQRHVRINLHTGMFVDEHLFSKG